MNKTENLLPPSADDVVLEDPCNGFFEGPRWHRYNRTGGRGSAI